jgi:hypothetical protein
MNGRTLIKSKGAMQLVDSLDGYPRATVIAENVPDPPSPHCRWQDGQWIDEPPPLTVEQRIGALESELAALKGAK